MYLMFKNKPVMHYSDGSYQILDADAMPFSIARDNFHYDDIYSWIANRAMPIGRTNAKSILAAMRIPSNYITICTKAHALSLSDCYWLKDDDEKIYWENISPFSSDVYNKDVQEIALTGKSSKINGRIHTPELATNGVSAKCWVNDNGTVYLYKVAKKEIPASEILDMLGYSHVKYEVVNHDELLKIANSERIEKIRKSNEIVVKCKAVTSEKYSMISFEDFCEHYGNDDTINPYDLAKQINPIKYNEMQIADYLLNNSDRHGGNWFFIVDNNTYKIIDICDLLDHDHSFSDEKDIISQTHDDKITIFEAAKQALNELPAEYADVLLDFNNKLKKGTFRPLYLDDTLLFDLKQRTNTLCAEILDKE